MRQNVENKWWTDPRRGPLIGLVTNHLIQTGMKPLLAAKLATPLTDGAVLNAWRLAEDYWIPKQRPIPRHVWEASGIPELLFQLELAERRNEDGSIAPIDCPTAPYVYVKGTKDGCQWYFDDRDQKREAGRASAAARRQREGTAVPPGASNRPQPDAAEQTPNGRSEDSEQPPDELRTDPNTSEPSHSPSPSHSHNVFSLSLPQSFKQRLKSLASEKARERERDAFGRIVGSGVDSEELAQIVDLVAVRGKDLRGNPIGSLMGYLESELDSERNAYRSGGSGPGPPDKCQLCRNRGYLFARKLDGAGGDRFACSCPLGEEKQRISNISRWKPELEGRFAIEG